MPPPQIPSSMKNEQTRCADLSPHNTSPDARSAQQPAETVKPRTSVRGWLSLRRRTSIKRQRRHLRPERRNAPTSV